jgi:hypothetical protein
MNKHEVEAKKRLHQLAVGEKVYFYEYSRYTSNIDELSVEFEPSDTYKMSIIHAGVNTFYCLCAVIGDDVVYTIDQNLNLSKGGKVAFKLWSYNYE